MGERAWVPLKPRVSVINDRPWVPHPKSKRQREKEAAASRAAAPAAPVPTEEPREPAADARFNQPD